LNNSCWVVDVKYTIIPVFVNVFFHGKTFFLEKKVFTQDCCLAISDFYGIFIQKKQEWGIS